MSNDKTWEAENGPGIDRERTVATPGSDIGHNRSRMIIIDLKPWTGDGIGLA